MNINSLKILPVTARLFIGVVVIPTLLAAIYYGLFASDIYISEAKYALRVNSETPALGLMESFIGSTSGVQSSNEDASIVMDFIRSRDMILELDQRLGLRDHYSSTDIDLLSRFDPDDSLEEFLEHYREMIEVGTDASTHVSTLQVRAFEPEFARNVAATIIELSEELVNHISTRIVEDSLQFARNEVESAEARVRAASEAITRFRSETRSINPGEETSAVLEIITGLGAQLAEAKTQLLEAQGYMQADSTQIRVLRGKVEALQGQIQAERQRLSSDQESDTDYTRLIDDYQPLVLEQELATKQYASTLASLEMARIEAQRKQRYLLPFVPPQVPDEAMEPKRIKIIVTIFIVLCIVFAIGGLVWAAIKDHMRL